MRFEYDESKNQINIEKHGLSFEEAKSMSKVKYTDAPADVADAIDAAERIDDFLPSPEFFAKALEKKKISLNVDALAVARFRAYAETHGLKYQVLMNQVLSNYAEKCLQAK
jgi:predicted DNA binding CopG/RHH family protein